MSLRYRIRESQYYGLPRTVYILAVGKMINCIGAFINPLLTLILVQKIGLSVKEAGYMVTYAMLLQAPFMILGGKLVDSIGPKRVIVIFQSAAAMIFIICGFMPMNKTLVYFLIAQSCLSALTTSCFDAIVGNITHEGNRKISFSLIYMGLNLGFAIGPGLGALMFEKHLSWLFVGDGITTLICALLIAIFVRNSEYTSVIIDRSSQEEKMEGSVFKVLLERPAILVFSLTMLLFRFVFAQFNFTIPIQLNEVLGEVDGAVVFGVLCSLNGLVVITFTPIVTKLTKNFKPTDAMALGGFLYSFFFGICGFCTMEWQFFVIVMFVTLGEILVATNQGAYIASLTPTSHRGRILSIIPIVTGLGYSFSASIMGMLITGVGIKFSWMIVGIVGGSATIMMYTQKYNKRMNYNACNTAISARDCP
ncbi:MAG: MFS transporter [Lachnospiraceae bacterium]